MSGPTVFGEFLDKSKGGKIADLCILEGLLLLNKTTSMMKGLNTCLHNLNIPN